MPAAPGFFRVFLYKEIHKRKCEWPIYTGQKAQRSGFLSERRNNGMDEGWAAKQTGTRDMKFVTTTLQVRSSVRKPIKLTIDS